jgi:1,4-alpha-glucan branching enzyme
MVSRPTDIGGLGFGCKWDMGWMHDTLKYMAHDPVHRRHHQDAMAFRQVYAFSENFVMSLSHDEVVHGKGSIIRKMPGDPWQRFANVRLLYAWMYALPGKKLLFMGNEFAQWNEWYHDVQLDWDLLERDEHKGIKTFVADLNRLYAGEKALWQNEFHPSCFEWIDHSDGDRSVFSFLRRDEADDEHLVAVFNFTPVTREFYPVGVTRAGVWHEIFNSDAPAYGGSGRGNLGRVEAKAIPMHGRPASLCVTVPPLGAVFFRKSRYL